MCVCGWFKGVDCAHAGDDNYVMCAVVVPLNGGRGNPISTN